MSRMQRVKKNVVRQGEPSLHPDPFSHKSVDTAITWSMVVSPESTLSIPD
jgi:hypothetical protein